MADRGSKRNRKEKRSKTARRAKVAAAVAGVAAAATAAGVAVAKRRSRGGTTVLHVRPDGDGWQLHEAGHQAPLGSFPVKSEAVKAGRRAARDRAPSELVIHLADGSEQSRHTYE